MTDWRRALLFWAFCLVVGGGMGLWFAVNVRAAPGVGQAQPLDLTRASGGGQFDTRIEKQTWWIDPVTPDPNHVVVNPGGLGTWDINDHNSFGASGYLNPGATTSATTQHVWDWNPMYGCRSGYCANWSGASNSYGASVFAPSPDLSVSVCFSPQSRCFTLMPVWNAIWKAYAFQICAQLVYGPSDSAIVDIAGSNGGRGVPSTMTLTVTNPSTQRAPKGIVKGVTAGYSISSDVIFEGACSGINLNNQPAAHYDYPFAWSP